MTDLEHIATDLRALARPLGELFYDPKNVRRHGDRNLQATRESLERFGQQKNVVARWSETGPPFMVVAGNGTLACAHALGWTHLAASVQRMDDKTALAYAIADNRTAELAEWDAVALDAAMRELEALDAGLAASLEFTAEERAFLLDEQATDPPAGEDPGPQEPPAAPKSKRGEVYLLGPHRLMCGDSTNAQDVSTLMNGEKARLMATDPPYLVDYDGTNHNSITRQHVENAAAGQKGGNTERWDDYNEASKTLFRDFIGCALPHLEDDAPIYQWHASRRQVLVEEAWTHHGLLIHQTIVWAKPSGVLTRSHMLWAFEPCFFGWKQGHQPGKDRRCPPSTTNVWNISAASIEMKGIHPTQKPLEVCRWPISWHLRSGELCYEPFGGSGTCIIAAALEGRRCNAMEMSPAFCDAIRLRWGAWARSAGVDPGPGAL
jgi:DNA modification methylase